MDAGKRYPSICSPISPENVLINKYTERRKRMSADITVSEDFDKKPPINNSAPKSTYTTAK
jgi:hypothetical protein